MFYENDKAVLYEYIIRFAEHLPSQEQMVPGLYLGQTD